ncbi:MAG TPA: hypothetical protein VM222_02335 [Planctomycetota bacterium]|nr:hypothetical protein [Planctomycetota bacterium]
MESPEKSLIYFHRPGLDLAQAQAPLGAGGMTVARDGELLRVRRGGDGPELRVRHVHGERIRLDAIQKARGTALQSLMSTLDAAFEIAFDNLDKVLADADTLTEVQRILQQLTDGVIVRSWNDELSGPGEE